MVPRWCQARTPRSVALSYTVYGAGPVVGALNGASNLIGPTPPGERVLTINEHIAAVFIYVGYITVVWTDGTHTLEGRLESTAQTAFDAIVSSIHTVDIETWLNALRRHRSATRLRSRDPRRSHRHPAPPGFDPSTVPNTGPVGTRFQLGIEATTETACGWIDTWLTATASRDQETS